MNERFNKLTPAEDERLSILAEECSEVIKTVMKIKRHGYESVDPTGVEIGTNRDQLQTELGDVEAILDFMICKDDVSMMHIEEANAAKTKKLLAGKYLHHQ
jgi:NTP pyrophosphatase (non-canonical NTP hydrolase)